MTTATRKIIKAAGIKVLVEIRQVPDSARYEVRQADTDHYVHSQSGACGYGDTAQEAIQSYRLSCR